MVRPAFYRRRNRPFRRIGGHDQFRQGGKQNPLRDQRSCRQTRGPKNQFQVVEPRFPNNSLAGSFFIILLQRPWRGFSQLVTWHNDCACRNRHANRLKLANDRTHSASFGTGCGQACPSRLAPKRNFNQFGGVLVWIRHWLCPRVSVLQPPQCSWIEF